MDKEEILKAIMELPELETNKPISAMNSISVDDLMSAVDRLNKVPTYDELLKENKRQKEVVNRAIEFTNKNWGTWCSNHCKYMTELQNILKEVSE